MNDKFGWEEGDVVVTKSAKNDLEDTVDNAKGGNPNHDKLGRFSTGASSGSDVNSIITGKAVMTEAEAKKATKDSKYKGVLYHGTLDKNARNIAENGFDASKNRDDSLFGKGTYLTPEYLDARTYAFGGLALDENNPPRIIKSYIDVKNPYVAKNGQNDITKAVDRALGKSGYKVDSDGYPTNIEEFVSYQKEYAKQVKKILETHDAVIIESAAVGANPMVVVRDTESIKIFKIEHANVGMQ